MKQAPPSCPDSGPVRRPIPGWSFFAPALVATLATLFLFGISAADVLDHSTMTLCVLCGLITALAALVFFAAGCFALTRRGPAKARIFFLFLGFTTLGGLLYLFGR